MPRMSSSFALSISRLNLDHFLSPCYLINSTPALILQTTEHVYIMFPYKETMETNLQVKYYIELQIS